MLKKTTLSAAAIAAIASGAPLPAATNLAAADTTGTEQPDAAAVAAAAALAAAGGTTKTPEKIAAEAAAAAAAAETTAAAATAAAAAAATAESELVKYLRSELATAQATITANAIKISTLEASSTGMAATHPKLLEIARSAVKKMRIALGASGDGADVMTAEEAITAHADTSATFAKKFVVGGAAATSSSGEEAPNKATNVTPLFTQVAKAAK